MNILYLYIYSTDGHLGWCQFSLLWRMLQWNSGLSLGAHVNRLVGIYLKMEFLAIRVCVSGPEPGWGKQSTECSLSGNAHSQVPACTGIMQRVNTSFNSSPSHLAWLTLINLKEQTCQLSEILTNRFSTYLNQFTFLLAQCNSPTYKPFLLDLMSGF